MYALINHYTPRSTDLSLRIGGDWTRCVVLAAGESADGWTRPSHAFVSADHLAALDALNASDYRREALAGFERINMGSPNADGSYEPSARAALAAAQAPRKLKVTADGVRLS